MSKLSKVLKAFNLDDSGDTRLSNLLKPPKKEKGKNKPHITNTSGKPNATHYTDLIFMPKTKKGNRYILTVVDIATSKMDAIPLKGKSSELTLKAMQSIYKRKYLNKPTILHTDDGTEFKGVFKRWMEKNDVILITAKVGRHRQQAPVESMNNRIVSVLNRYMMAVELQTNETFREWDTIMDKLVRLMNEQYSHKPVDTSNKVLSRCQGDSCNLLAVGTKVRHVLDYPRDIEGRRLHGEFRTGDMRFDPNVKTITTIKLLPTQPPLYVLDGDFSVSYTKEQLQAVHDYEKNVEVKEFIVESIVDKRKVKKETQYKIKYKDGSVKWIDEKKVLKVDPKLVKKYNDEIERRDQNEEYDVEHILRHRKNPKTKQLEYLVKWTGYPSSYNLWLHENMFNKSNVILRTYKKDHNIK